MRTLRLGLVVAFLLLGAGLAVGQPSYQDVSVADILEDPAGYAGERVRVHGFLIFEFEGDSIWVDEAAFRNERYERGFWVDARGLTVAERKSLSGRLAYVSGTLDIHKNGHLNLWAGTLGHLTAVEADAADTLEARPWRTDPIYTLLLSLMVLGALLVCVFIFGDRKRLLAPPPGKHKPPRVI